MGKARPSRSINGFLDVLRSKIRSSAGQKGFFDTLRNTLHGVQRIFLECSHRICLQIIANASEKRYNTSKRR